MSSRKPVATARPTRTRRADPKGRILRAAAHLFRTQGYARTTVRELADAVGILSGSLFHHFSSKEHILEAVMAEVIQLNTERLEQALETARSPRQRVRALIRSELLSIHGETGEAMTLLFVEWRSLPREAQQRLLTLRDRYEAYWLEALGDLLEQSSSQDIFVLRKLLTGAIAHTATWYRPGGPLDLEGLTDAVTGLIHR